MRAVNSYYLNFIGGRATRLVDFERAPRGEDRRNATKRDLPRGDATARRRGTLEFPAPTHRFHGAQAAH